MGKLIYALRSKTLKKIKIGESNRDTLFSRLASLQTGSADELEIIGVHYGYFGSDREIHPILKLSHSHLEWFNETEEVTDFVVSKFLVFPKPLSLLKDVNSLMDKAVSPETIAIKQYTEGRIDSTQSKDWFEQFNMLDYLNATSPIHF
ncbi:GIY-YIG nuclease family protein [Aliivibrio wodanis]|uniref:GIY-YIG nuclease family protein n=1 Tax=Aliivibrio wodanis TaxID=80852 RepID=UPI00406C7726